MRKLAVILSFCGVVVVALFFGAAAILASGDVLSEGLSVFSRPDDRFFGKVAGEFSDSEKPLLAERRSVSSEFRPTPKDDTGVFAVPTAHSAILLDAGTESALYEKDADTRRQIASITKLMTVMIVVEEVKDLDESATISEKAVRSDGTKIGCPRSGYCIGERLHIGEKIPVRELLKAALMNSANDSALALAEHVSGSEDRFVEKMNQRAQELGLSNSHFCTASGLEPDGRESECYSSARDVAKIAAYALKYDVIWKTMLTEKTNIYSSDKMISHEIFNTNELLGRYPNLVGTKTGFTPNAGYSLLAVAGDPESGKHRLVAVLLNDPYRWQSVQQMFSYGFSSFEWL